MQSGPLKVLLVEDNRSDQRLIEYALKGAGFDAEITCVESEPQFRERLLEKLDVVLCDWALPDFDAMRALHIVRESYPDLPFIIISGSVGEEAAVQAIKQGATDYLLKDRLGRLGQSIRLSLTQRHLLLAERQAREALQASEEQYRTLAESIPQIVWTASKEGTIEYVNRQTIAYGGATAAELVGEGWFKFVHPEDLQIAQESWAAALQTGVPHEFQCRFRRFDGEYRWHVARQVAVRDSNGAIVRWLGTCTDIHEQITASERLATDAMLLSSVRDSVIVTDLDGIVTYWNDGATRLFGWTAEEMLGRPYSSRFPEPIRSDITEQIQARIRGDAWYGEYEDLRKDGSRVWIHARVAAFADSSGKIVGVLGVAYDITDLKRAEQSLSAIMRSVSDAIISVDADGKIASANSAVECIFGYLPNDIMGRCFTKLLIQHEPLGQEANGKPMWSDVFEPQLGIREFQFLTKSGKSFSGELLVTEFEVDGIKNFTCVIRDVSERKRLEEQFRQAQKLEAVGRLAGGIAHDFNNLLTVINSYAEMLLADALPNSENFNAIAAVRDAGERASRLTSQLITYSRQAIVEAKPLDLNEFVQQYEELLRRMIGADVRLNVKLAPSVGCIKADRSQLDQVVMNLVVNARDAMPNGGNLTLETREVIVRQDAKHSGQIQAAHFAELVVTDTGCGMTQETMKNIFEPFFTTKDAGKGTGLGLAVVDGIVKQSGGNISVETKVDRGTTFSIRFPVVERSKTQVAAAAEVQSHSPPRRIMLVEDEPSVRRITCLALESLQYVVIAVASAQAALELIEKDGVNFDLLITDVVMPEMSGRELAEIVRARYPDLKVLFVSGYTEDHVVRHGVRESAEYFLQKPFTPSSLAKKIAAVIKQ